MEFAYNQIIVKSNTTIFSPAADMNLYYASSIWQDVFYHFSHNQSFIFMYQF